MTALAQRSFRNGEGRMRIRARELLSNLRLPALGLQVLKMNSDFAKAT